MDSEASELLEARPSSDPLPVSSAQSRLPEQSRDVPSTIPSPSLDHMLSVMDTVSTAVFAEVGPSTETAHLQPV